ncbi:uncharacterized protein CYBJADRAFT_161912 [Cyberlindnera jadinii NRRL Y-1542]|uniref:Uncharacterized protein n=1 Tax=Cyberlindnera jadinii (strain ATCC 18201 / CBS 1600 / BCRC 20928 / JCM 3617 / NBRC 0987 / NRRL Y-1542) TaxID=983966 RepID=A0A1E4S4Q5_CYBJN|nr:hypothetical protein CYBJADRAFT_161912 [Cyberlindnera jadinii NRRL Y-1542]ODV74498.1 hypothetical protein CYBJADRAFT_161912 [Cyberlindnera jadinii NRRL Y-1542]
MAHELATINVINGVQYLQHQSIYNIHCGWTNPHPNTSFTIWYAPHSSSCGHRLMPRWYRHSKKDHKKDELNFVFLAHLTKQQQQQQQQQQRRRRRRRKKEVTYKSIPFLLLLLVYRNTDRDRENFPVGYL